MYRFTDEGCKAELVWWLRGRGVARIWSKKKNSIVLDKVGLYWSSVDENHGLKSNLLFSALLLHTALLLLPVPYP